MNQEEILIRLFLALIIGGITGLEREKSHKFAGFRTHILVSLGSCIASITSLQLFFQYNDMANLDPSRLSAQVLSGIGFLGAGTILKTKNGVKGLTTAAGIWSTACIGLAIGYGYYFLSIVSWMFVICVLFILKYIDMNSIDKRFGNIELILDDNALIPLILDALEEKNIDIQNMNIEQSNENWILKLTIYYKKNMNFKELVNDLYSIKNSIVIDYIGD
ncbi:MAG: MgtC/SapB family protein [Romboutsia sp.]